MLNKLSQIDKLASPKLVSAPESKHAKHFNSNLPILLKVLAKSQGNSYLLKLGNTTLQTTSHTKLEVGKSYWANMQSNHAGQIVISKLVKKPDIDELVKNMPLKLSAQDLSLLATNPKAFTHELKDFLLSQLANAAHKEDFRELAFLTLSLAQGVLSLVVSEDGKDQLLQLAPKKSRDALEFYAIFPQLGPISGSIWQEPSPKDTKNGVKLCAQLAVMNERVQEILQEHSDELGLDSVQISSTNTPKELFSLSSLCLLDVRT